MTKTYLKYDGERELGRPTSLALGQTVKAIQMMEKD